MNSGVDISLPNIYTDDQNIPGVSTQQPFDVSMSGKQDLFSCINILLELIRFINNNCVY